jgi:outer membrane immunogenic protein
MFLFFIEAAKATDSLEGRIAILEKENAVLKKENAALRVKLNVAAKSEQKVPLASLAQDPKGHDTSPSEELAHSWNGWYVGGNIGYGWGNSKTNVYEPNLTVPSIPASQDLQSMIVGVQAGYNWEIGNKVVVGLETDLQNSSARNSTNITETDIGFGSVTHTREAKLSWFGTVRGRAGALVTPDILIYGTAGVAYGNIGVSGSGTFPCVGCSVIYGFSNKSSVRFGAVFGGGIEGAVAHTSDWTWKAEYLHLDFGHAGLSGAIYDVYVPVTLASWNMKLATEVARFGVNYSFH